MHADVVLIDCNLARDKHDTTKPQSNTYFEGISLFHKSYFSYCNHLDSFVRLSTIFINFCWNDLNPFVCKMAFFNKNSNPDSL